MILNIFHFQVMDVQKFWKRSYSDGVLWSVTFLGTVLLDVDIGLLVGVCCSIFMTLAQGFLPWVRILKQSKESEHVLVDKERFKTRSSSVYIVQFFGPLNVFTIWILQYLLLSKIDNPTPNKKLCKGEKEIITHEKYIIDLRNVTQIDTNGPELVTLLHSKLTSNEDKVSIVTETQLYRFFANSPHKFEHFNTLNDALASMKETKRKPREEQEE